MIAVKRVVASVVDTTGGEVESLEEEDGIIAHMRVNCKGGLANVRSTSETRRIHG